MRGGGVHRRQRAAAFVLGNGMLERNLPLTCLVKTEKRSTRFKDCNWERRLHNHDLLFFSLPTHKATYSEDTPINIHEQDRMKSPPRGIALQALIGSLSGRGEMPLNFRPEQQPMKEVTEPRRRRHCCCCCCSQVNLLRPLRLRRRLPQQHHSTLCQIPIAAAAVETSAEVVLGPGTPTCAPSLTARERRRVERVKPLPPSLLHCCCCSGRH